jgi:hypothetical protein
MLNSGKKLRALRDKKKHSNSRVVRKKIFWTKQKTIPDVDNGCSKGHGRWKTDTIIDGYIKDSVQNRLKISQL